MSKTISVEQARSVLREYPDADLSAFDVIGANGEPLTAEALTALATEEASATIASIEAKIPDTGKHLVLAEGDAAIVLRKSGTTEVVAHEDDSASAKVARNILSMLVAVPKKE